MRAGWLEREPDPIEDDPHALLGGHRHGTARAEQRIVALGESEFVAVHHLESVI